MKSQHPVAIRIYIFLGCFSLALLFLQPFSFDRTGAIVPSALGSAIGMFGVGYLVALINRRKPINYYIHISTSFISFIIVLIDWSST